MDLASLRYKLQSGALIAMLSCVLGVPPQSCAQGQGQESFTSSKDAVDAFVDAARKGDLAKLRAILGPDSEQIVSSGDDVDDKRARDQFVSEYELKHSLVENGSHQFILKVGNRDWPLPIPLVYAENRWFWDGAAGRDEIRYRRIGRNELDVIRVCKGVLAAQREYASSPHDGHPPGAYASRIVSEPGTQNGLYWEVPRGVAPSPAGPLLAQATAEGYDTSHKHTPYHGYYYRMLRSPEGFGFLAYPATYRSSGVMTFIVDQTGAIYQKDLGENTAQVAEQLRNYERDHTWTRLK